MDEEIGGQNRGGLGKELYGTGADYVVPLTIYELLEGE
jgi:hypothetical protein